MPSGKNKNMKKKNSNPKEIYISFTSVFVICALAVFIFSGVMFITFRASMDMAYVRPTSEAPGQFKVNSSQAPVNQSGDPMVTIPE